MPEQQSRFEVVAEPPRQVRPNAKWASLVTEVRETAPNQWVKIGGDVLPVTGPDSVASQLRRRYGVEAVGRAGDLYLRVTV